MGKLNICPIKSKKMEMDLKATQNITVFIDKKFYGNTPIESTIIGKIPKNRRENINWKGCYYTIEKGEVFAFDRSNDWDKCFFKLINGAEFSIDCGNPNSFIEKNNIEKIN